MKLFIVFASFFSFTFAQGPSSPRPSPPGPSVDCTGIIDFEFLPAPNSCSDYYQCIGEVGYRLSCPRGYYFSPNEFRCMPPSEANCVITPPPPPPTFPPLPVPEVNCTGVADFEFLPTPNSCTDYYQCIGEVAYRLSCPRGYYFSRQLRRCVPSNESDCVITPPPTPTLPPTTPPSGPTISCSGVPNFRFVASPVSCVNYYQVK